MHDAKRRLILHGMFIVLLGLLTGAILGSYTTPRLGLAAHVGAIMNGTLVAVIGAVWDEIRLSPRSSTAAFWSTVYSGYANWAGLFLAAVFGTSRTTPMLGAGHSGTPFQEAVVAFFLMTGAFVILAAITLVLMGLRPRR